MASHFHTRRLIVKFKRILFRTNNLCVSEDIKGVRAIIIINFKFIFKYIAYEI